MLVGSLKGNTPDKWNEYSESDESPYAELSVRVQACLDGTDVCARSEAI